MDSNSISSQIDSVLMDVEKPVTKTIYKFEDELKGTEESNTFLLDEDLDIKQALDISDLNIEQAKKVANQAFNMSKIDTILADIFTEENIDNALHATGNFIENIGTTISNAVDAGAQATNAFLNQIAEYASALDDYIPRGSGFSAVLGGIASVVADNMRDYVDGVTETSFGANMEESWAGKGQRRSFLDYFASRNSQSKVRFLRSTPLDPGKDGNQSFYGTMVLGVPYRFNSISDPTNRTLINSLIKDSKYLSLTPGMPKYNGTSYTQTAADSILMQTSEPTSMLSYLTRNGLDKYISDKDKRYYTFKTDYAAYYAYLETMLNTIWIKLGLAEENGNFNLYTFFDIIEQGNSKDGTDDKIAAENIGNLKSQYKSIGFYTNASGAASESIDSQQTGFGANLADEANSKSSEYQNINYITGMGTAGAAKNVSRKIGIGLKGVSQVKDLFKDTFAGFYSAITAEVTGDKFSKIVNLGLKIAKSAAAAVTDVTTFMNTKDLGATIQSFATANGMKVVYPELWSDSSYSKNMNFNFSFVSPYGDPMSIFKYVYVPFCALACFAMPRQAAENGYVSPFFVRADVPGVISSDLALVSSFTWTRGGSAGLWTKDGLPRMIDCSITITDLYPYLSMTKRLSYLSANPSYSVFLDSMCGMLTLGDGSTDDDLNAYFIKIINRVNGLSSDNSLWNKFNSSKSAMMKKISSEVRESMTRGIDPHAIPWLYNPKI